MLNPKTDKPPAEGSRVIVEAYRDGTGWFVYSPSAGRIGTVWAQADTKEECLTWCAKNRLKAEVF